MVLANSGTAGMLLALPRLLLLGLLRALAYLLTRRPLAAVDELAAVAAVISHPGRLRRLRRARAASRTVPARDLAPLLARRAARLRSVADALGDLVSGGASSESTTVLAEPSGGDDDLDALTGGGGAGLLRLLRRPPVALTLLLTGVALLAERSLFHGGELYGGRLLPPPSGVSDLWSQYLAAWHPVGPGSADPAAPFLVLVAGLGVILLGKAWLAVALLLLACVPLAGLTAYAALGRVTQNVALRFWGAAVYALLPALTGAVAAGRLGPAVAMVLLPPLLVSCQRVLAGGEPGRSAVSGRRPWVAGLLLALTVAFAPGLYPVALVLLSGGVVVALLGGPSVPDADGDAVPERRAVGALVVAAVPVALLFPWSLQLLRQPSMLSLGLEPGTASEALNGGPLSAMRLLLLQPGGPGTPPSWTFVGLGLAALAGLLHPDAGRARAALGGIALAGVALVAGLLVSRADASVTGSAPVHGWPGEYLVLAGAGLLLAAVVAADGVQDRLGRSSFGWRQPTAALLAVLAVAGPVVAAGGWVVRGVDGPLRRGNPGLLPAFASAELAPGERVLYLGRVADGVVTYDLSGAGGARLGDAGTVPGRVQQAHLDAVVTGLVAPGGGAAANSLATYAVRFVAVPRPVDPTVQDALDAQGGLSRESFEGAVALWRVANAAPPLSVAPPALAEEALTLDGPTGETLRAASPSPVEVGPLGGRATLPSGGASRLLVLAQARDAGWRATLDGRPLTPRTAWGWAQAWSLPSNGGELVVGRADGGHRTALVVQGLLLLAVLVLAAPPARGRGDDLADLVGPARPTPGSPS